MNGRQDDQQNPSLSASPQATAPEQAPEEIEISDNYFENLNNEFEQAFISGEFRSGETVNEIIERNRDRERQVRHFVDIVGDFFTSPIEAIRWFGTRIAAGIFGERLEEYSRALAPLQAARETVDEIMSEGQEVISNPTQALDGAIDQLRGVESLTDSLPSGSLTALRMIPGLRSLLGVGAVGAAAFGIFSLRADMNENPDRYTNMPETPSEQAAWWEERLSELDINENVDEIIAIVTGQQTISSLFPEEAEEQDEQVQESDEVDENIEMIPLSEAIDRTEEEFQQVFALYNAYAAEQEGGLLIGGAVLSGAIVFTERGRSTVTGLAGGVASNSMDTLRTLSRIPLSMGATSLSALAVAFGGLYVLRDQLAEQARETGQDIGKIEVPADPEELRRWIFRAIEEQAHEGEEWVQEKAQQLNSEELDAALDYVSGVRDDLRDLQINPGELIEAGIAAPFETIGETVSEQINHVHRRGVRSMIGRLRRADLERYQSVISYLEELKQSLEAGSQLTIEQIDELIDIASQHNIAIAINEETGLYQWARLNDDLRPISGPFNLFIDPILPENRQVRLAEQFRTHERGLQSYFQIFGVFTNNTKLMAENIAEMIQGERAFISLVGDDIVLNSLHESYIIGPLRVYGDMLTELGDILPGGDRFQVQEVLVEWADMLVPAIVIGVPEILIDITRNGLRLGLNTTLRVATRPITLPINVLRFGLDTEYRHLVGTTVRQRVHALERLYSDQLLNRANSTFPFRNRLTEAITRTRLNGNMLDLERRLLEENFSTFRLSQNSRVTAEALGNLMKNSEISESVLREVGNNIFEFRRSDGNFKRFNPSSPDDRYQLAQVVRNERRLLNEYSAISEIENRISRNGSTPELKAELNRARTELETARNNLPPIRTQNESMTSRFRNLFAERTISETLSDDGNRRTTRITRNNQTTEIIETRNADGTWSESSRSTTPEANNKPNSRTDTNRGIFSGILDRFSPRTETSTRNPDGTWTETVTQGGRTTTQITEAPEVHDNETYTSRSELDAEISRVNPDVGARIRDVDAQRPTSPSRARNIATALGSMAVAGGGAILSSEIAEEVRRDHNPDVTSTSLDETSEDNEEEPEPTLEVMDYRENPEILQQDIAEFRNQLSEEFSRFYDNISSEILDPANLEDIDGDTYFMIVQDLVGQHEQNIASLQNLVAENGNLLMANFELLDELHNYERNPRINVSDSLAIEYDISNKNIIVRYTTPHQFDISLWDNYDMVNFITWFERRAGVPREDSPLRVMHNLENTFYEEAAEIDNSDLSEEEKSQRIEELSSYTLDTIADIRRSMNTFYTSSSLAAYIAPGSGTYMDFRTMGNDIARGRFWRGLGTGIIGTVSGIADVLSFGTAGTAIRGARNTERLSRFARFANRVEDNVHRFMRSNGLETALQSRTSRIFGDSFDDILRLADRAGAYENYLYYGMQGIDLVRPWLAPPELDGSAIVVGEPEARSSVPNSIQEANERSRDFRESHFGGAPGRRF